MPETATENKSPASGGTRVRTRTLSEYLAEHPLQGMFPPTSQLTTKIVMAISYLLILAAIIYIVLRATGVA